MTFDRMWFHGLQDETFVCQHIVGSLRTRQAVGFHWPASLPQRRPDAWCSNCEKRRVEAGGVWTEDVLASVGLRVLCGGGSHADYDRLLG
jgi:hypothetical protein